MGEKTGIVWCTSSWSPWIGCTEVSDGCNLCYARELDKRHKYGGATHWGVGVPRYRTKQWHVPLEWNKKAEKSGRRWTVFPSLCDPFDNEVPMNWQRDLMNLILATPALTWLLLTKRIGNVAKMMASPLPVNVWLGSSVVNQEEADRDLPKLLARPATKRFLSLEPLLSYVDLSHWLKGDQRAESGNGVLVATGNRGVFGGPRRDDMASSTAHSRQPRRDAAVLEGSQQTPSGTVEVGRLSNGNVLGRDEAPQGVRSPDRMDGPQSSGHSDRHGSEPREREARRHSQEELDVDDAIAKRDSRNTGVGTQEAGPARHQKHDGEIDGGSGVGHQKVGGENSTVPTREDVRGVAGNYFQHRNPQNVGGIDWVIIGGESSQGGVMARPFDIAWARSTIAQCKAAGVPCLVKQLGSHPYDSSAIHIPVDTLFIKDRAGANPAEWPADLRVQEFPA